jgi:F-type H+-transporting ATPase subunit delta
MKITKQARRAAKALFRACFVNGQLDETRVRQAVKSVIEGRPRGYAGVLSHFERLVRLQIESRTAKVESATPLAADLKARVQENLDRLYGAGLNVSFVENPALIGGLRIKIGSDVYDGSLQARLAALQDSF